MSESNAAVLQATEILQDGESNKSLADRTSGSKGGLQRASRSFLDGTPALYLACQARVYLTCQSARVPAWLPHTCKRMSRQSGRDRAPST